MKGYIRTAAVSLPVHLGDVYANETEILIAMENLRMQGVQLAVFPELCLCGATLGDLMHQPLVVEACWAALERIAAKTGAMAAVVGLPVQIVPLLQGAILLFVLAAEYLTEYKIVFVQKEGKEKKPHVS